MIRQLLSDRTEQPARVAAQLAAVSRPLSGPESLDPLFDRIGDSRYVLLGEASHGTAEYYTWRAEISKRLIREKGFTLIGVEGDWPDCYRITRHIKGFDQRSQSAREVLRTFQRWPTWMWANEEISVLVEWLRAHNAGLPLAKRVGFYGLDVYSLWESLYTVMAYLQKADPSALPAAWQAFHCFEPFGEDVQKYARATLTIPASCESEVIALLTKLRRSAQDYPEDGHEVRFNAEQNALVVKNAEHYYRMMIRGGPESWNVRDRHMTETLDRLMQRHGPEAKAILWMHNTHIGDARFTDMALEGMVNVGQLVRMEHEQEGVFLVGFGSYEGSVIAGRRWEAPFARMRVPRAQEGSWEQVFHSNHAGDQIVLSSDAQQMPALLESRGHRAIGVVYRPERDYGNYVPTVLPQRYDAFLYLDRTEALHPLHGSGSREHEVPETYPSGM